MFLEKCTYPWYLKLGSHELQVVSQSLNIAAESGELDSMSEDQAVRLHENIEREVQKRLEKDREYRESKERDNKRGGKREHREHRERDFSYDNADEN
jgi:hypothetical protein